MLFFKENRACGEVFEWNHSIDNSYGITKYVSVASSLSHQPANHFDIHSENLDAAEKISLNELQFQIFLTKK